MTRHTTDNIPCECRELVSDVGPREERYVAREGGRLPSDVHLGLGE